MSMSKKQAVVILQLLDSSYNMQFASDDLKTKLWVEQLTKFGDYEETLLKTKQHISRSKFKPTISEVLKTKAKRAEAVTIPEEETHEYKMQHDSEYATKHQELKERWKQLKSKWVMDDE
ncbi:hypothetical protein [uncultured Staphylococcus sp.]|uniref:hypothetical protein n=1 Tax=uncultured Staphylococcus sp. TaxID=189668 RepID=UPI0025E8316C|nr:hypothetical protein [uncultured Staphylococcus sp.]